MIWCLQASLTPQSRLNHNQIYNSLIKVTITNVSPSSTSYEHGYYFKVNELAQNNPEESGSLQENKHLFFPNRSNDDRGFSKRAVPLNQDAERTACLGAQDSINTHTRCLTVPNFPRCGTQVGTIVSQSSHTTYTHVLQGLKMYSVFQYIQA